MNKYKWITSGWILLVSLLLIGCTGVNTPAPKQEKLSLPAITKNATHKYYPGKFVWHDLLTDDISAAKEFYSGLFGWTFEEQGEYCLVSISWSERLKKVFFKMATMKIIFVVTTFYVVGL